MDEAVNNLEEALHLCPQGVQSANLRYPILKLHYMCYIIINDVFMLQVHTSIGSGILFHEIRKFESGTGKHKHDYGRQYAIKYIIMISVTNYYRSCIIVEYLCGTRRIIFEHNFKNRKLQTWRDGHRGFGKETIALVMNNIHH